MTIDQAIILGVVQGLTEFLPVSSSGHLVVFQKWIGLQNHDIAFDIACHLGTLFAIVLVYRKDIIAIAGDLIISKRNDLENSNRFKPALFIILSAIPTAAIGFGFKSSIESVFDQIEWVATLFILMGLYLYSPRWFKKVPVNKYDSKNYRIWQAVLIGLSQGVAVLPGVSRSGTTITTALLLGFKRDEAARLSFLMSVPVILGAVLLEAKDLPSGFDYLSAGIGMIVSFLVGYVALLWLIRLVQKGRIEYFAIYLWILGIAVHLIY